MWGTGTTHAEIASSITFYVATDGNDSWSGTLAEPNKNQTDGPFATIFQARDSIRERKTAGGRRVPVKVLLRGGKYYLKDTFRLGPEDSGTAESPVTYRAYPNEKPVLSCGRVLTTWKKHHGKIWSSHLPSSGLPGINYKIKQLFYRRDRQTIARYPNLDPENSRTGGFLYMDQKFHHPDGDWYLWHPADELLSRWAKPDEVEVNHFQSDNWTNRIEPLRKILDDENRIIAPAQKGGAVSLSGNRFYVQGAMEELDAPGEWHQDLDSETIYFWPPDDEVTDWGAVVPLAMSVIVVKGDFEKKQFVEHVTFSHLGVECCEQHGVILEASQHCQVVGCRLEQIGRTGIVIGAGSRHCRVAGNDVGYPGGHAVAMYDDVASPLACSDNVITNNYGHHCGEHFISNFGWGTGICISGHRNVVSHNLIHDTSCNPMNFNGWDNVIEYNEFHHGNLESSDCSGIYAWADRNGDSLRNTIRYNHVHDIFGYGITYESDGKFLSPSYSWGIYLDDYTSGTTVVGNLVYRTAWGGLMLHGGSKNVIENNVFADGIKWQLWCANMAPSPYPGVKVYPEAKPGSMFDNRIRNNIFYHRSSKSILYRGVSWLDQIAKFERNLIYAGGKLPKVELRREGEEENKTIPWEDWLAQGHDTGSITADPLFVNPRKQDYRLQPGSPALSMGFKPLPIGKMGLEQTPERASWPIQKDETGRDQIPQRE